MPSLPVLPATVIGSWAFPGWYARLCEEAARDPDLFGPDDRDEAVRDAVRLAVDDQLRAGADLITDGVPDSLIAIIGSEELGLPCYIFAELGVPAGKRPATDHRRRKQRKRPHVGNLRPWWLIDYQPKQGTLFFW